MKNSMHHKLLNEKLDSCHAFVDQYINKTSITSETKTFDVSLRREEVNQLLVAMHRKLLQIDGNRVADFLSATIYNNYTQRYDVRIYINNFVVITVCNSIHIYQDKSTEHLYLGVPDLWII